MKNPIAMTRDYPEEVIEGIAAYSRFIGVVLVITAILIFRTPDSIFLWSLLIVLTSLLWVAHRASKRQAVPQFILSALLATERFFVEESRNNEIYKQNEDKARGTLGAYPISEEADDDGWEKFPKSPDDGKWRV